MSVRTANLTERIEKLLPFITYKLVLLEKIGEKINDYLCQAYNLSKIRQYLLVSMELTQEDITEEVFIKFNTVVSEIEGCYDTNNLVYPEIPTTTVTTTTARLVVTTEAPTTEAETTFAVELPSTTLATSTSQGTTTEYSELPTTGSTTTEAPGTTTEYSPLPSATTTGSTTEGTTTQYSELPTTIATTATPEGTTTEYSPLPGTTLATTTQATTLPNFTGGELVTTETTSGTTTQPVSTTTATTQSTTQSTTAATTLAPTTTTTTAAPTTTASTTESTTAAPTTVTTTTAAPTTVAPIQMQVYTDVSAAEACNKAVLEQGIPVTVWIAFGNNLCDPSSRIFVDEAMTTPYDSGTTWIASWLDGCAVQTNASGYIVSNVSCETVTTTTTAPVTTTTCNCPNQVMISDFHATQLSACGDSSTGLIRCTDTVGVALGTLVSDDCCDLLAAGFYKVIATNQWIQINANGEVIDIGNCIE